jgi:signal peptidase II
MVKWHEVDSEPTCHCEIGRQVVAIAPHDANLSALEEVANLNTLFHRSGTLARWSVLFASAAVVLAIDQISKAIVTSTLSLGESWAPIPAIADYFNITRSTNTGAALGILPQAGDLFLVIALVMILAIFIFYRRLPEGHWLERIALGILLGGVTGNAIDRIRLGYVVDFVHVQFKPFLSNVSNLADHSIVIAIGILFITQWLNERTENRQPAPKDQD